MLNDNGIAWMIAGGQSAESREDQRQLLHRIALAESRPSRGANLFQLRQRIAAAVGGGSEALAGAGVLSADCCAA
jgi:hypothetical protein